MYFKSDWDKPDLSIEEDEFQTLCKREDKTTLDREKMLKLIYEDIEIEYLNSPEINHIHEYFKEIVNVIPEKDLKTAMSGDYFTEVLSEQLPKKAKKYI